MTFFKLANTRAGLFNGLRTLCHNARPSPFPKRCRVRHPGSPVYVHRDIPSVLPCMRIGRSRAIDHTMCRAGRFSAPGIIVFAGILIRNIIEVG